VFYVIKFVLISKFVFNKNTAIAP